MLDAKNGKLTITHARVDLGSLNWSVGGTPQTRYQTSDLSSVLKECSVYDTPNAICEVYPISKADGMPDKHITIFTSGGTTYIRVLDSDYVSNVVAFKTSLQNKYLVYELATPVEIDITANNFTTFTGENNIFADCGDVSVSFKQGIQEYIDAKIAETQA